ncbi:hypothetical protein N7474_010926 [Penicillium riverlandense]|uniref:uncharacterized protein n=1 Tax=Penicillium riverlandense TaxID=1903569 RepID=UPI0025472C45|nr:uncharacterized protein N7474_010926 [Penicillium riverlandense]KAJ5805039.1 hypothetical protein N7474_010926 [Penicillium riverlandense]
MSTNRPFLANFLAAFRAPAYKASSQTSSSLGSAQITQSAHIVFIIITFISDSDGKSSDPVLGKPPPPPLPSPPSSPHLNRIIRSRHLNLPTTTNLILLCNPHPHIPPPGADRQRRGSDSSSGSGGFRDALGPEKWYIGGRTPAGEERFYRLGMVTKGGGRLGGSGRVGSIDQLSL